MNQQQPLEPEVIGKVSSMDNSQALTRFDPSQLLSQAIDKGIDIAGLEKLMDLQERWERNRAKALFFEALALFQSRVPKIEKTSQGYGYLYAKLGEIDKTIKQSMEDCGLSKRWTISEDGDKVTVVCVITHVAGHSESSAIGPVSWDLLEKTKQMNGLQHRAAVIQYLQRYTCIAALGLTTADEDTDAQTPPEVISETQAADLDALAEETKRPGENKAKVLKNLCVVYNIAKIADMPVSVYPGAVNALNAKRNAA